MSKKMSDQALEKRIKEAFTHATPHNPSSALSACDESTQKGRIIPMNTKKKSLIFRVAAIAAAVVLCCGVGIGLFAYDANGAVATTVSLDVNPSVEITLNKGDKVLAVTPLNEDGEVVVGEMDFKGVDLDVAVNALIGSMVKNGYINELSNSILLSVNGKNTEKSNALRQELAAKINDAMLNESVEGSVLSQTVEKIDNELKTLAEEYGISAGKAQLIRQFVSQDSTYTFEELVDLTINELNLLSESGSTKLENVELSGKQASDKKYVGKDAAREAVLNHAGVLEDILSKFDCEMDFVDGRMIYEIKFDCEGFEHDYMIDAESGEIFKQSKKHPHGDKLHDDDDKDRFEAVTDENGEAVTDENGEAVTVAVEPEKRPEGDREPIEEACTEAHITAEEALAKAVEHAGLAADAAIEDSECELGRKRSICVYEVEFDFEDYEYEYLINASTGDVVKYQKEAVREDDRDEHKGEGNKPAFGEMESRPAMPEFDEEMTRPEMPEMPEMPELPEKPEGEPFPEKPEHNEGMPHPELPEGETFPEMHEGQRPGRFPAEAESGMERPNMNRPVDEAESADADDKGFAPLK